MINPRQEANRQILAVLANYIESYPDIRFSQALSNLGIVKQGGDYSVGSYWRDEYYVEPYEILKRLGEV